MRYALGVLLIPVSFAAVFAGLILVFSDWHTHSILYFFDMPTLVPFIFVISTIIFMSGEFKVKVRAANALFSKNYVISARDKEKAIRLFKLLARAVIYVTVITTMISLSLMLMRLEDPSTIGPYLSLSMLSIIYGALINLALIYPAIHILENRPDPEPISVVISEKQVIDKLLELCYKQGVPPEEILEAKEISFKKQ